jgi:flagellar assembly protein FliH
MSSRIIRSTNLAFQKLGRFKFNPAPPSPHVPVPVSPLPPPLENNPAMHWPDAPAVDEQSELILIRANLRAAEIEKEAYEKGFAEGRKAGSAADETIAEALLSQYSASLEQLNKLRRDIFANSEREVIRLALEIGRKVVKREISIDDEIILTLVKVALNRVAGQALVTIRVNPKDYEIIEKHHSALPGAGPLNETVKLVEDPLIGRGGCVIETEGGTVDARIEEQLSQIERGLFE